MKQKRLAYFATSLSSTIYMSAFMVTRVFAVTPESCTNSSASFLGFPTWYKYLNPVYQNGQCVLQTTMPDDLGKIGLALVEILLRLAGLIAVAFVIYGGFNYITSQGEPDKTKSARQRIVNALIGLVITIFATVIVSFIGREFA